MAYSNYFTGYGRGMSSHSNQPFYFSSSATSLEELSEQIKTKFPHCTVIINSDQFPPTIEISCNPIRLLNPVKHWLTRNEYEFDFDLGKLFIKSPFIKEDLEKEDITNINNLIF